MRDDMVGASELAVRIESRDGVFSKALAARELVIAGWTGRDREAMERHIAELAALGVTPPDRMPTYYRVSTSRLTTAALIEVSGTHSSGEAEFILATLGGETYVGLGSDHTDREVEAYGITVAKQICDKPVSATLWPLAEVEDHWDELILRSHATFSGERRLYQEGSVASMLAPDDLIRGYCSAAHLAEGTVLFGGTLPAIGGVRPAERFEAELEDPVLGRRIELGYELRTLPVRG